MASRSVRDRDLLLRPRTRPADVLRVVPGMFVNQHAGGGKANQYFLRGFDADHGTDIALSFDGIPANMVSHGHGQGYADLNWVIPELVASVDTFKGPYSVRHGDFANAGSIDMVSHDRIAESSLSLAGGLFGSYRALAIAAPGEVGGFTPLAAAELYQFDGPFENQEGYQRYSTWGKLSHAVGDTGTLSLAATSYRGKWNASGQLPLRAIEAGQLDRFGAIDPSDGGDSERHSLYARYRGKPTDNSTLEVLGYGVASRLALFSNFTFFSADPDGGDQIAQRDERVYGGLTARYRQQNDLGSIPAHTTLVFDSRADDIDTALAQSRDRAIHTPVVDAAVKEARVGAAVQEDVAWRPWLRTVVGVRADWVGFDVDDRLAEVGDDMTSGSRTDSIVSPKASLVLTPTVGTDVYLNAGAGYHSNDARAVVRKMDPGTPLARSRGYELGARTRLADRIDLAGSLWMLDLDSETVWVGDEGVTESRGATRRLGFEIEARAALLPWLHADLDVTATRARFVDAPAGADRIPLAPTFTATGGLSARHPNGIFGRLGMRVLSDRPLTEDGFLTAEGFTLLDLTLGYRTDRYELSLAVDNLTNTSWREAQFATTSRLASDPSISAPPPASACPAGTRAETGDGGNFAGCEDVHFTPGSPLNAMFTARMFF